ncbi:hypothetical protein C8A05DRAFT_41262 [Staphylotrichum tortipilum]|uniref:Uncharacterized protein n=1 Tax=Staphylotrichum tortipilum TaxID=2831512 RepID=A0AAN6MSY9_9PEZI|nr:hypothetical protein C8A05DRAFT_41262 [Staphylotrichum longicolle]
MARKKNQRAQAQQADPEAASQLKKPLTSRPQAQSQPKEKAKKPAKTQHKPAVEDTNIAGAKTKLDSSPAKEAPEKQQAPPTSRGPSSGQIASPRESSILGIDETQIAPVDQLPGLLGLLQVAELRNIIINLLVPSIGDLTALALTCKRVAVCMKGSFERWDTRSANFPTDKFVTKKDDHGRILQEGGTRSKILVVSPASAELVDSEKPYMTDFTTTIKLCEAMAEIPLSFKTIVLDNLPFLTVGLFEQMVKTMPNLEAVTITRCVLLDVTKLKPLLEVVKRHPRGLQSHSPDTASRSPDACSSTDPAISSPGPARKACNQNTGAEQAKPKKPARHISLDFAPFFFRGPCSADRQGCYGVTHNEPTFHTPKAVFALILSCWPLAQEVKMDLVSDSSSFWGFVRQLPGPDALWAIKAREALVTREVDMAAKALKTPSDSIDDKFADDLTAALTGDNHKHTSIPVRMTRYLPSGHERVGKYWRCSFECGGCKTRLPMSLFPLRIDTCWACKMGQYVINMDDSHLRLWMESAMDKWLSGMITEKDEENKEDEDGEEDGLPKLLRNSDSLAEAFEEVRCADWVREHYLFSWKPPQVPKPDPTAWVATPPPSYCPPPPKSLDVTRASLARWRAQQEPTAVFDYRHGGPQRHDPCKSPLASSDDSAPAEASKFFNRRWEWTLKTDELFKKLWNEEFNRKLQKLPVVRRNEANRNRWAKLDAALIVARTTSVGRMKMRRAERHLQNKADREVHRWWQPRKLPFNKDEPFPDPGVDRKAYNALRQEHQWNSSGYGHVPDGFW